MSARGLFSDAFLVRFYAKVAIPRDQAGEPDQEQCWLWIGEKTRGRNGVASFVYGHMRGEGDRAHVKAHRVALAIRTGVMPDGQDAAHREGCEKLCCNPWHLTWETPEENRIADLDRRYGASNWRTNKRWRDRGKVCRDRAS
jgi:hypothetical protein